MQQGRVKCRSHVQQSQHREQLGRRADIKKQALNATEWHMNPYPTPFFVTLQATRDLECQLSQLLPPRPTPTPASANFSFFFNIYKVGNNSLANRLYHINDQIPLTWLNASKHTFKVTCKRMFLHI